MKALLCTAFGPIDRLRLEDVAVPEPAALSRTSPWKKTSSQLSRTIFR